MADSTSCGAFSRAGENVATPELNLRNLQELSASLIDSRSLCLKKLLTFMQNSNLIYLVS